VKSGKREEGRGKREEERGERQKKQLRDLRKSIEICPPTPNSGGDRDQSPPELGDLGGECISPKLKTQNSKLKTQNSKDVQSGFRQIFGM